MDRWRGFLIQAMCIGGVVTLAVTGDREMKMFAFMILSGALGANVTRGKVDAALQAVSAVATGQSVRPPPPSQGPNVTGMIAFGVVGGLLARYFL